GVVAQLSAQRAREIFSLRALLESFAVRLALTEGRIGAAERRQIESSFAAMERCAESGDTAALIDADMAFHWAICAPCGHELLLEQLRGLQVRTRQCIYYTKFYESDVESEVAAHTPPRRATQSGEPARAGAAMRAHIAPAGERLLVRLLERGVAVRHG